MKILILLLVLLSNSVWATSDFSLYLGGWSHHLVKQDVKLNQSHDLVVVAYSKWFVGTMINSYDQRTHLGGYQKVIHEYSDFKLSYVLGATYGYTQCPFATTKEYNKANSSKICPLAAAKLQYAKFNVRPTLLFTGTVFLFTTELRF